mmetsp:Transcript_9932/g.36331  ORF Transcript_9932/g.36331 Transcript_9932/m.36331 type:complete len:198 (-) Transcript_9932:7369-7962(-)
MKITCLAVLKQNGEAEPWLLGAATDLSNFGYFQRSAVKEMLMFVSRTVAKRTAAGQRQTVEHEEYLCHAFNKQGLVGACFVDREYPMRSAFSVVNKVLEEYAQAVPEWQALAADDTQGNELLAAALRKYQDPEEADKLLKIQKDLDETKVILHKTIDSVLARGEKLDSLVDKSSDLSMASQMFYKQARKTNSCCNLQ